MSPDILDKVNRGTLPLIAVVGPTASGKTRRAVSLAKSLNAEIISGDSRQVYKGMDIGTGKDLEEYGDVPFHLIDICPAGYKYNLHEYLRDYEKAESEIRARGHNVILCGGTGMYVEAVLSGMRLPDVPKNSELRNELKDKSLSELAEILSAKKTLHNTTDVDTCARAVRAIEIQTYYEEHPELTLLTDRSKASPREALIVLVDIPREERRQSITRRLDSRLLQGMEQEVRSLLQAGVKPEDLEYYGLEYKFVTKAVTGEISREQMRHDLEIAIHQFAKRQMTWFRGMIRRGFTLHPVPWNLSESDFTDRVLSLL
ncbi:MAG: tRNA (adenosine(37)-N6)-dimethylallyltransferase MiaA [Prevotella sp.]|nr:tRNA (adenosine(37)-N6)-dimethylallyltransferase MiaA [Prevotella sp.]MCM1075573.1 tRNA (adenosine(37)-N6)-dimethylallyltransferase MiaA [Ruminococcus sp.]